jgi:hypothetical protein
MIKRIVFAGVLVLALMIVIKDGRVLKDIGLTGVCSHAQTFADGSQLQACRSGKLAGAPDLSRQGCTETGPAGKYEYWRCPAGVASGPNGR